MNISDHQGIRLLLDRLGLSLDGQAFEGRYNVSPGASLQVASRDDAVTVGDMRWGVVPHWAKPGQFSRPLINARAETIREKPSFRHLVKRGRAIIPVTGFYEWQRTQGHKRPFHFKPARDPAFALAGLCQTTRDGTAQVCVITTQANRTMAPVHDRMPVILQWDEMETWLTSNREDEIDSLMRSSAPELIEAIPVSDYVNNARNEGPRCVEPVS